MMLKEKFSTILIAEEGAITVDWVVLTAAVISLSLITTLFIWDETEGISRNLAQFLGARELAPKFGDSELGN